MALLLKLGALDVSNYVQVAPDAGFDPMDNDWIEPAFVDSPFGDGQPLAALDVKNREMVWPVLLRGAGGTKDQLHTLVQQINNEIARPTTKPLRVEWRDSGATDSTFYDVAHARLEPNFNYRRSEKGYGAFILRVWAAGYGHTGTDRLAATAAGTAAAMTVTLPSIAGDAPAITEARITTGSFFAGWLGRTLGVARLPHPSYIFDWAAPSITRLTSDATLIGATQAQGSQAVAMLAATALPSAPLASYRSALQITLSPASVYAGQRHRLLGIMQANTIRGVALNHSHAGGIGPTALASFSYQGYELVDLGVVAIPSNPAASYAITLQIGDAASSGRMHADYTVATEPYALHLNRLLLMPENDCRIVVDSPPYQIAGDSFVASGFVKGLTEDYGNVWNSAADGLSSPTHGLVGSAADTHGIRESLLPYRRTRDFVLQTVVRVPPSAAAFTGTFLQAMVRIYRNASLGLLLEPNIRLASGRSHLTETVGGASVAIPSTAHAALLLEVGKIGTQSWLSVQGLNSGLPLLASAAASYAGVEAETEMLNLRSVATHTSNIASWPAAYDRFALYSVPSEAHIARGIYRLAESVERADASGNLLVQVDHRTRGVNVRAVPSTPAFGVVQLAPGKRAMDMGSVEIRVRECFTYAR